MTATCFPGAEAVAGLWDPADSRYLVKAYEQLGYIW